MTIRFVRLSDTEDLLKIYAQYIDTPITFEETLPSIEEFQERIRTFSAFYPYLVCEEDKKIIGYAYAHRQMERAAYQWNAELSIYLDKSYTSRGLGRKLYRLLIALLQEQGIHTVYSGITVPNEKSERLHTTLGFSCLGTYHNTGYKCGKWRDVSWYEKALLPYEGTPAPVLSIQEIPKEKRKQLIQTFSARERDKQPPL
ncbi:N-acetyltransferase [Mediterraneibacter sp. NSJ-55]|uniref:N-acetyltransferase n=1 Tax=Mediterraneibacter hominis TaxID=2763054 RepID=A0A923LK12_9FIRM|nr:GNAT family N-acetyltransferase [Mediterraneibacter hominis]MBC5689738.1 N-acetyltransferase [Mediterraneibacter hominis]